MTTGVLTEAPALDPFQLDTLSFLDNARGRAVIADPMGARKTGTILAWLSQTPCGSVLIVAPSSVHRHWAREAAKFYPQATVRIGKGTKAKREAMIAESTHELNPVYITTYESMKGDQHAIEKAKFDTVVFDEGHRLKGRRTQVALAANRLTHRADHVVIATGTPVINHAAELWQYLHMLAPKVYPAFWKWARAHYKIELHYFRGRNRPPTEVIKEVLPGHEDILRKQIEPFFIQRDIEDLFSGEAWIAPAEHVEIEVELSPAERKEYDRLVKYGWGMVGGREITTQNSLDLTTRLTQLTSEWATLGADEAGTKTKAAVELINDLVERDEKVVVFCKYKATVRAIMLALNGKNTAYTVTYHGDQSPHERDSAIDLFTSGPAQVLVGTLDSLSEGVDGLQSASHTIVMVDRHWTPAKNDQAIGRLRRSGQLQPVQVYHVFAADTVDATITEACLRKANVIQMLKDKPLIDSLYGRV